MGKPYIRKAIVPDQALDVGALMPEELKLVRLIGEYETTRMRAAFAEPARWPELEAERRVASDALARALRSYTKGFLWRGVWYGYFGLGNYLELTRCPGQHSGSKGRAQG